MKRTLILIRHGKAEPSRDGLADEARQLTSAGRAALEGPDGFTRTFALLSDDEREGARFWVSTATRARQTAEAAAAALGCSDLEERAYLFAQDGEAFLDELESCYARLLVVVAHIPFVERMTEYLCGAQLDFSPGAAAAIELDEALDACESKLLWFVQGPCTA